MKNRILFSAVVLGTSLTALSAFAEVSNGHGYNGPDLTPISIPGELDRGVKLSDIATAMDTCLVNGDSKRGLISLFQNVLKQHGQNSLGAGNATLQVAPGTSNDVLILGQTESYFYKSIGDNTISLESNLVGKISEGSDKSVGLELDFFEQNPLTLAPSVSALSTGTYGFPYVTYTKILRDGFDDLGNPDTNDAIVSGLAIMANSDIAKSGATVPLMNGTHTSSLTVNEQEYVQCLQSEIQSIVAIAPASGTK